jgi:hypothetical protein
MGLGRENQNDVPESRSSVVGVGLGWREEGITLEFGALRRNLRQFESPTSADDRLVGTLTVAF